MHNLQVAQDPNAGKHPLWTLRTPAEAREHWDREFGHLSRNQPAEGPISKGTGSKPSEEQGSRQEQGATMAEGKKTIHSSSDHPGGKI